MTPRPLAAGRRLLARTPLEVKLIVATLALVAVALALIGLASVAALDGYLVGRLDSQLQAVARQPTRAPGGDREGPDGHRPGPPSPFLIQYRDPAGKVVDTDSVPLDEGQPPEVPDDSAWLAAHAGEPVTVPAAGGDGRWRVLVQETGPGTKVVAASLEGIDSTTRQLRLIDLVVSLVVLVAVAGVGAAIVRASLRPLVEIEQTARAIAAGDLTRRVPERDPRTEVGRLGRALNTMLTQIESAFGARAASEASARRSEEAARRSEDRMRRFVADASHELRTPLTTIRGFAELYRQGAGRDPAELDRLMRRIEDQAAGMGLLVEDLLLLARLDRQRPLERTSVDLLALAAEAVHDARAVAPDRRIELVLGTGDGDGEVASALIVLGDEQRLRQVLANLVGNALTHTPAGSPVEVRVGAAPLDGRPGAAVEVVDHGPGLTPEQAERVFERFYRADPSRSQADGGTGLGLSIVAALVAVHGGTVQVDSVPGRGARFRVVLPLAPDAAA
ncbi:MAG TPA: HAMP domain-containing sensor histidine kinase [Actinomycetota bacterium]|jgi:two-component system OmpR family sensor kinase|nr:HAMP domain-containing sensor histidine kinase [Actinomycetota bacterium]